MSARHFMFILTLTYLHRLNNASHRCYLFTFYRLQINTSHFYSLVTIRANMLTLNFRHSYIIAFVQFNYSNRAHAHTTTTTTLRRKFIEVSKIQNANTSVIETCHLSRSMVLICLHLTQRFSNHLRCHIARSSEKLRNSWVCFRSCFFSVFFRLSMFILPRSSR